MKAEMGYLKSKLNVLETEILQCKNKLKKIANEIQLEQKNYNKQFMDNGTLELKILSEIEKLKSDIDMAQVSSDSITKSTEALKNEVIAIDSSIIEKKKQLEKLIHEMKQVNLESLSSPEGEYCSTLENTVGTVKRKIIGSPRQLENAVATSKNPHGVWV
jgi:Ras association domain-containing protein 7/8